MPIDNNLELTADEIYMSKLTMDEVGADIETEGFVPATEENRTLDPSTPKGSLANALDDAICDFSNPNNDTTNETNGEIEGTTQDPQNGEQKPQDDFKTDDTTMDEKPTKDSLSKALDAITMDGDESNEPGDEDTDPSDADERWLAREREKNRPEIPEHLRTHEQTDENGLVWLEYTFKVDPATYRSSNYQPIADSASIGKNQGLQMLQNTPPAPSADGEEIEVESAEKGTEDEAVESFVMDYATAPDETSVWCFDEDEGIDYSTMVMDAKPKKAPTRQNCKTTFAQCRAKNPLYCRFHGPKLLEKDIKTAITAAVGKGCVVQVTKDKGNKSPTTFRLTIGCAPQMKDKVEKMVHMFMTQNPGISSPEEYKDLGDGKETMEFEMDIMKADKPPKKGASTEHFNPQPEDDTMTGGEGESTPNFGKSAQFFFNKPKMGLEEKPPMETVGETPAAIEKAANQAEEPSTEGRGESAAIESAKAKVKEALKGTEYEGAELKALGETTTSNGNKGGEIAIAQNDERDLKAIVSKDGKVSFRISSKEGDLWETENVNEAIAILNDPASLYGEAENEKQDIDKNELEDEFDDALLSYPDDSSSEEDDVKNLEIHTAFKDAFENDDYEGMKSAIEAMKKLSAEVAAKKGKGTQGGNEDSNKDNEEIQPLDATGIASYGEKYSAPNFFYTPKFSELVQKIPTKLTEAAYSDILNTPGAANPTKLISTVDDLNALLSQQVFTPELGLSKVQSMIGTIQGTEGSLGAADAYALKVLEKTAAVLKEDVDKGVKAFNDKFSEFESELGNFADESLKGYKSIQAQKVMQCAKDLAQIVFPNGPDGEAESVKDVIENMAGELDELFKKKVGDKKDSQSQQMENLMDYESPKKIAALKAATDHADAHDKFSEAMDKGGKFEIDNAAKEVFKTASQLTQAFLNYKHSYESLKQQIETMDEVQEEVNSLDPNEKVEDLSAELAEDPWGTAYKLEPLVGEALQKNGKFTKFKLNATQNGLLLNMQRKQPEGWDSDEMGDFLPIVGEVEKLTEDINEEFGKKGLQVEYDAKDSYGKNVQFVVIPKKKNAYDPKKDIGDFLGKAFSNENDSFWTQKLTQLLEAPQKVILTKEEYKKLSAKLEMFPPDSKFVKAVKEALNKTAGIIETSTKSHEDKVAEAKEKLSKMSYGDKLAKAKYICEKRLKANPDDKAAKEMLAKVEKALKAHSK